MDEYNSLFQAKIFSTGQLSVAVPELWRPYARALTPIFVTYDAAAATWSGSYLPVYAALRALCLDLGLTDLLNPFLAIVSLVLVADCAGRLWPEQPQLRLVAATLLLSSAQFWAMSISYYSMPAHLCANLLWVSLYLRGSWGALALLPWLGGLAIGLHQPVVHPLFVAPFCVDILRRRRFVLASYCLVVYSGFLLLWYGWLGRMALEETKVNAQDFAWFSWPDAKLWFVQTVNLTLSGSWQSAALVLCFVCALVAFRSFTAPVWALLAGVALTLALYCFFFTNQGHGWGYRYIYGVLGNVVLLATYGWSRLSQRLGQARALRLLVASTCVALFVQIPLRAFEIEREIRPFAHAQDFLRGLPEKIVVVDRSYIWYGQDLIRNDPSFADRPLLIDANRNQVLKDLQRLGTVRVVRPTELARFKIPVSPALEQHERARQQAASNAHP